MALESTSKQDSHCALSSTFQQLKQLNPASNIIFTRRADSTISTCPDRSEARFFVIEKKSPQTHLIFMNNSIRSTYIVVIITMDSPSQVSAAQLGRAGHFNYTTHGPSQLCVYTMYLTHTAHVHSRHAFSRLH